MTYPLWFDRVITFGYTIFILLVSVAPKEQLPLVGGVPLADKWAHAVAYAVFAILWYRFWKKKGKTSSDAFWRTLIFASLFGCLMEFCQYAFTPGRFFEIWDMIANTMGALVALLVIRFFIKPKP